MTSPAPRLALHRRMRAMQQQQRVPTACSISARAGCPWDFPPSWASPRISASLSMPGSARVLRRRYRPGWPVVPGAVAQAIGRRCSTALSLGAGWPEGGIRRSTACRRGERNARRRHGGATAGRAERNGHDLACTGQGLAATIAAAHRWLRTRSMSVNGWCPGPCWVAIARRDGRCCQGGPPAYSSRPFPRAAMAAAVTPAGGISS